jgi:hypothetical protein
MVLEVADVWKIIGIVSAGNRKTVNTNNATKDTCNLGLYSVFTDVSKFHDRINQIVLETFL